MQDRKWGIASAGLQVRGTQVSDRAGAGTADRLQPGCRSALDVLGDRQSRQGGLDASACLGNALLQVGAGCDGVAEPAFERAVFFRQSTGDFNQARHAVAQDLDIVVHAAGW